MIHFNELRVTPDSKYLIIEAEIDYDDYYKNVVLDRIIIDNQDTYKANGPSENPIYEYEIEREASLIHSLPNCNSCNPVTIEEDKSYCFVEDGNPNGIRLILSAKDLGVDLLNNMFFVYAIAKGTPSPETPCGFDDSIKMGTVVNLYPFYKKTMSYIRELNNECNIPKGFINIILLLEALNIEIKVGNYLEAIRVWKRLFINKLEVKLDNNCNCNGRN